MEIAKSMWTTDGDNYSISLPLTKIDKENRLVSGWASLDNPDLQGDIVLSEASQQAFKNFRGNIREMHQPVAVGRMIDWRPDSYYDPMTQKFYNGVFVTVYVSKGAESTWEKVCDGTLQAFSIKGPITDYDFEFSKDAGKPLRIIKGYELEELSLVDSGGNQLANVVSIQKSADGYVVKGMVTETSIENVFYCDKHENAIAKTSTENSVKCPEGHTMQNIGWFENDGGDKTEKINSLLVRYHSSNTGSADAEVAKQVEVPANNEGGVDVAEETTTEAGSAAPVEAEASEQGAASTEVEHSADEQAAGVEEVEAAGEEEPVAEKAANVSEVEAEEPDFAKMFGDLQGAIEAGLTKNRDEAAAGIEKAVSAFESRFNELAGKHEELSKELTAIKAKTDDVEKSLRAVESETAVKKSGDLGGSTEETLEKSNKGPIWGGRFLSTTDL